MSELKIAAKASVLCVFIFSVISDLQGWRYSLLIPILPFIVGYLTLREKDVFFASFSFMIFNVVFSFISIILLGNGIYLDVLFPVLFYYSIFSPFFFSLGGIATKKTYILYIGIILIVIVILLIFSKPGKPQFYSSKNFFYLYNAYLVLLQIWRGIRKFHLTDKNSDGKRN